MIIKSTHPNVIKWSDVHVMDKPTAFVSFAGGVAVAYVFLHMLPELLEYNKPIGEFLLNHI